jgi:HEAT repeats
MKSLLATWKGVLLIVFAGIVICLLCLFAYLFVTTRQEPQYQGRKLTEWADEIDQQDFFRLIANQQHQKQNEQAIAAIRHIGTNALPVALELCRAKNSWLKEKTEVWADWFNFADWPHHRRFQIHIKSAGEKYYEGVSIIWALGPMAKPVIPDLIRLMQSRDPDIAGCAMSALPGIGTNAIPPLFKLVNSTNEDVRLRAAIVLGDFFEPKIPATHSDNPLVVPGSNLFRSQARVAVPVLLTGLENRDLNSTTKIRIIRALGLIKEDASKVVPVLVRQAQSETNSLLCGNYFWALGRFGTSAQAAVPILVKALRSKTDQPDSADKQQALVSLLKINPTIAQPFYQQWEAGLTNVVSPR